MEAVAEKPATGTAYSAIVQKQRDFFWSHATKPIAFRKKQLRKLKAAFSKHEAALLAALKKDLVNLVAIVDLAELFELVDLVDLADLVDLVDLVDLADIAAHASLADFVGQAKLADQAC